MACNDYTAGLVLSRNIQTAELGSKQISLKLSALKPAHLVLIYSLEYDSREHRTFLPINISLFSMFYLTLLIKQILDLHQPVVVFYKFHHSHKSPAFIFSLAHSVVGISRCVLRSMELSKTP